MTISHGDFFDFHTGGAEQLALSTATVVGNNATDGHPAPGYAVEEFTATWANDGIADYGLTCNPIAITTSTWQTCWLKCRWADFGDAAYKTFMTAARKLTGSFDVGFALKYNNTGRLRLVDNTGATKATHAGALLTGKEYYFQVKWRRGTGTAGYIKAWYWERGGVRHLLYDGTANTGTDLTAGLKALIGGGVFGATQLGYVGSGGHVSDDGANIDSENTTHIGSPDPSDDQTIPEFNGQTFKTSSVSNTDQEGGDNLNRGSGNWNDAEVAPVTVVPCGYSLTSGTPTRDGYILTNHATNGGPAGAASIRGTIKAAQWVWTHRENSAAKAGARMRGRYGHSGDASHYTPYQTKTTVYATFKYSTGWDEADAGVVPDGSETLAWGFEADRGSVDGWVDVKGGWASVFHFEPAPVGTKTVILDGLILQV